MLTAVKNLKIYVENTPDGWKFNLAVRTRTKLFSIPDRPRNKLFSVFLPHLVRQAISKESYILDDYSFVSEIIHGLVGYKMADFKQITFVDKKTKTILKVVKDTHDKHKLSKWAISNTGTLIIRDKT